MKKKILSQLMILSFAFAGLFLVGNNVFGDNMVNEESMDNKGIYCYYVLIESGPDYIILSCMGSIYNDPSHPSCSPCYHSTIIYFSDQP